jgi:hypothetical protein
MELGVERSPKGFDKKLQLDDVVQKVGFFVEQKHVSYAGVCRRIQCGCFWVLVTIELLEKES